MSSEIEISLKVNGKIHKLEIPPNKSLLGVLREDLKLTSVKYGCGTGDCGNCTVLMDSKPVHSCIILAPQAQKHEIVTIEGIARTDIFKSLREAFMEELSFQCGYCAPAITITAYVLLKESPNPSRGEVRRSISSILCRCTGYQKIVDGIMKASKRLREKEVAKDE